MSGVSGLRPCARTHLKKGLLPYSSGLWDRRQIPITSKPPNSTGRTFLIVVWHLYSVYLFCYSNIFVSTYFSCLCVFILTPKHNNNFLSDYPVFEKITINVNFHDKFYHSSGFSFKICPIWVRKKRKEKESMICLTPKRSQKNFRNNRSFLWPPSSPDLNLLGYAIWDVLKTKKMQLTIQILVCLRLLLRWNWIKCLKNLFWRQAIHFESMLIQWLKKMMAILSKLTILRLSSNLTAYF